MVNEHFEPLSNAVMSSTIVFQQPETAQIKKADIGRPFGAHRASGSGHGLDSGGQPTLVAGCLVLVDDLLVGDGINGAGGFAEHSLGGVLVAGFDRFRDSLDCSAQLRTQARIVVMLLVRLSCALSCLCAVCHENSLKFACDKRRAL